MRHIPLIAAAIAVLAFPAHAQPKKVEPAAALAAAEALIAQAGAEDVFAPGAWEYGPTVRHERSGMSCRFAMGVPVNAVKVNDPPPTRGDDVSCSTAFGGVLTSHFASRVSLVGRYEAAAAGALAALEARVGDSSAYTGPVFEPQTATLPPIRVHRLVDEQSGHKLYERLAVMDMGDWIITQRVTAPLPAAGAADRLAWMSLAAMAKEMRQETP